MFVVLGGVDRHPAPCLNTVRYGDSNVTVACCQNIAAVALSTLPIRGARAS